MNCARPSRRSGEVERALFQLSYSFQGTRQESNLRLPVLAVTSGYEPAGPFAWPPCSARVAHLPRGGSVPRRTGLSGSRPGSFAAGAQRHGDGKCEAPRVS